MNGIDVVATTGDPAFAVDREGRILAWNEAAVDSLGYRPSEVIGRRCWRVLQGRDLFSNCCCGKTCAVRDMALRGDPVYRTQVFFQAGSGEKKLVSMSTFVVSGAADKEIVHLFECLSSSAEDTRSPSHAVPTSNHSGLSPRQLEVLEHLGNGKGTEEIAELLGISPVTARHHLQHIFSRLKVHSRLEAVTLARRIGLI